MCPINWLVVLLCGVHILRSREVRLKYDTENTLRLEETSKVAAVVVVFCSPI